MQGGFLMPGLVDAHVHLFLDGAPTDGATRSAHLKLPLEDLTEAARRASLRLKEEYGMPLDHIFIDMSVSAIIADTEGLNSSTVEAIRRIGADPDLAGVHMMGGLSNIGQQLPPKAADGSDLKHCLESAFLTLTVPHGFDYVLGTPWRGYQQLEEDHYVLSTYRNFLEQRGSNALRAVRKFYRA